MRKFLLFNPLLLLFLSASQLLAQDSTRNKGFGIETNFLAGRIIKHSASFTAPVPPVSMALDVSCLWQTYGKHEWEQRRGFPLVGVGMMLTDYNSKNIFGRCLGLYPNIQVPLIRGKKLEWTFRWGVGVAYVTKKYQLTPTVDTINTAVSTNVNAFGVYIMDLRYHKNEHWDLHAGLNFTHISNGLYREPNLGVNMGGFHFGVRYFPTTSSPERILRKMAPLKNRWSVEVRGGTGQKEARAAGKPIEPSYVGAVSVSKRYQGRNKVFMGVDAVYHKDVYAFLKNYGVELGQEKQHSWDGGIFVGHEFLVGRVGMLGIVGTYYRQTFLDFDPIYERLGAKYYFIQHEKGLLKDAFLSVHLTTHGAVAEYTEFGLGVAF